MVLQPVLVALWLRRLPAVPLGRPRLGARVAGPVALLALAAAGVALATRPATSYLGLVLAWAGPPLALQWAVGGDVLARRWRLLARAALPPALYLCAVDRLALHLHLWQLSSTRTTGAAVLGLPVEEAVFFALTTALLAGGLILGTDRRVLRRCVPRAAVVPVGEAGRTRPRLPWARIRWTSAGGACLYPARTMSGVGPAQSDRQGLHPCRAVGSPTSGIVPEG